MRLADNQLEATTKATIAENEAISNELAFQSRETERLLRLQRQLEDSGTRVGVAVAYMGLLFLPHAQALPQSGIWNCVKATR